MPPPDAQIPTTKGAPSSPPTKKRKRKDGKPHILHHSTFRKPTWTYFRLSLITPSATTANTTAPSSAIDPLTVSPLLMSALNTYLGMTGAAIPVDILKTQGREVWVRVPRQDARGVRAALSGWVGSCDGDSVPGVGSAGRVKVAWRVVEEAETLFGAVAGDGGDLFGD
jgi:ribonuclease P/MRP protein subunit POP8